MAFKKLSDYTTNERFDGREEARIQLALRKALNIAAFNTFVFCQPTDVDPLGKSGAELVKISYIDELSGASTRKLGVEGKPVNIVRKTEKVELGAINSAFDIDRRQYKSQLEAQGVINDNMNNATQSVAYELVNRFFTATIGDEHESEWNGLNYYFNSGNALDGMNNTVALTLASGIETREDALKFGKHIRKSINSMGVNKPNFVYTNAAGLELIQSYNVIMNLGIKNTKIGDVDYEEFMGVTAVQVPEGALGEGTNEAVFVFARCVKDKTGLVVITSSENIFDPIMPDFDKVNGRVAQGSNEIVCAPVPLTTECAARCRVTLGE